MVSMSWEDSAKETKQMEGFAAVGSGGRNSDGQGYDARNRRGLVGRHEKVAGEAARRLLCSACGS